MPRKLRAEAGPNPSLDEDPDFDWDFAELELDDSSQLDDNERPKELMPPPTSTKVKYSDFISVSCFIQTLKYHDPLRVLTEYIAKVGSEGRACIFSASEI